MVFDPYPPRLGNISRRRNLWQSENPKTFENHLYIEQVSNANFAQRQRCCSKIEQYVIYIQGILVGSVIWRLFPIQVAFLPNQTYPLKWLEKQFYLFKPGENSGSATTHPILQIASNLRPPETMASLSIVQYNILYTVLDVFILGSMFLFEAVGL